VALLALGSSARAEDAPAPAVPAARGDAVPGDSLPDVFAQALADAHLTVDELGFRPRASWPRYPTTAPFKMPFFDDLLAHPLDTYEFTRTLGNLVEDHLTPQRLAAAPEEGKPETLFPLAVALATDRRLGGMRGFGFGLLNDSSAEDQRSAIVVGFSQDEARLLFDAGVAVPLARLMIGLAQARASIKRGLRNVSSNEQVAAWNRLPSFVANLADGSEDVTAWEDLVARVDAMSLAYGSLQALAAVQRARRELAAAMPKEGWPDLDIGAKGPVRIVSRADRSPVPTSSGFGRAHELILALTPVSFTQRAGGTTLDQPLSVALFLEGAERLAWGGAGGIASGIFGCGIVWVAGNGSTTYDTTSHGLGAGVVGTGILVDEGGDDVYRLHEFGQGAAVFGAGLLLDAGGNDRYELSGGDGQGLGGPGGVGVLADRAGDDVYAAETSPEKAGASRADYHSDGKVVVSNAQGVGVGRRGDLTDGHAWAGGLGALVDVDGNDRYAAGNFSQGVGYWFGTGLLWDGGGDDAYDSVYFSHGSGAHFAIGAVVDEGGDDRHVLSDLAKTGLGAKLPGAGVAFGWDVVNAFVIDRAGNDRYESGIISLGTSNVRSMAFLLDEGGDDVYVADEGADAFGAVDERPEYVKPGRSSPFPFHLPQAAVFLDLGGVDRYLRRRKSADPVADAHAGDDRSWSREAPRGPGGGRNVAVARAVARGRLGFLDAWPRRVAPPRSPVATPAEPARPSNK
jgi:hypothetical protein